MLARIFLIGSSWALLSLIVGLLVGRLIFAYQETPAPGHSVSLQSTGEFPLHETEEAELGILEHAHVQGAR